MPIVPFEAAKVALSASRKLLLKQLRSARVLLILNSGLNQIHFGPIKGLLQCFTRGQGVVSLPHGRPLCLGGDHGLLFRSFALLGLGRLGSPSGNSGLYGDAPLPCAHGNRR